MADAKLISFAVSAEAQDPTAYVQTLAACLSEESKHVLVVTTKANANADSVDWVSQFEKRSPRLLRNYLGWHPCFGELTLPWPLQAKYLKPLLTLLMRSYEWVLVLLPEELGEEAHPLLGASSFLIWLGAGARNSNGYDTFLKQLTKRHYAHQYARAVNMMKESPRKLAEWLATSLPRRGGPEQDSQAVHHLREQVQPELLKALEDAPALDRAKTQEAVEECLAQSRSLPDSLAARDEIVERVLHEVLGLGPLEALMKDTRYTEIMVNGPNDIWVEENGKIYRTEVRFLTPAQLRTVIDRIVSQAGRRVDESMPLCDARLADGSRVNVVLPPLALEGPTITIRKFSAHVLGLEELLRRGSMSREMIDFLERAVQARRNLVVSGGTGSGKTTLLNALSGLIADNERIVTIEDAAELRLRKSHVIRLESRPPNAEGEGAIAIRRLVMNALRMRPDRIIVGECRGGEALDMLQAMNTGHEGSMTTVHANSPRDALGRLETLALMAGLDLPLRVVREQIRSAIHVVVQQARLPDGSRKVTSITEITGMEGDVITLQELFAFKNGSFLQTGYRSVNGAR